MYRHQPRLNFWLALLLAFVAAWPAAAAPTSRGFDRTNRDHRQLLLRTDAIEAVTARHGLEVLERHDTAEGTVFLVSIPAGQMAQKVLAKLAVDPEIGTVSDITLASLPAITLSAVDATNQTQGDLSQQGKVSSPCLDWIDTHGVWRGFADQRAAQLTQLHAGQYLDGYWCGWGMTVAVIDTAIDSEHPLLQAALVDGYDFLDEQSGLAATQTSELDTKTRAIVEGDLSVVTSGSGSLAMLASAAVVMGETNQEVLDDLNSKGAYFGHGTMVAGLIRLTAPAAKIMPLEVFSEEGVGHPFDVVRAIDYAVAHGADVINMSFSIADDTPELQAAVERARQLGVMTVAAAGNNGEDISIYPAAYSSTIGVAATDFDDQLTDFTNFGLTTADLTAPGAGVVTLYPGGLFATGWGTSFSTPLVSGNVALIRTYYGGHNRGAHRQTRNSLLLGTWYFPYLWNFILASGRLDTVGAVYEARY